ncbi:unnamed protein product, partial [Ectocarpus sp. 12 AP-2014]
ASSLLSCSTAVLEHTQSLFKFTHRLPRGNTQPPVRCRPSPRSSSAKKWFRQFEDFFFSGNLAARRPLHSNLCRSRVTRLGRYPTGARERPRCGICQPCWGR